MDDKASILMFGFLVGGIVGILVLNWTQQDLVTRTQVIDAGCGHYDEKTGEFVMGKIDN